MSLLLVLHLLFNDMMKAGQMEYEELSPRDLVQREDLTKRKESQVIVLTVEALTILLGTVKRRMKLKV